MNALNVPSLEASEIDFERVVWSRCALFAQTSMSQSLGLIRHKWQSLYVFQYVLRRRDAIQSEYDSTLEELNKRKDEREQVRFPVSQRITVKIKKNSDTRKICYQSKIWTRLLYHKVMHHKVTKRMEELNDKTVCADSGLQADMERWHRSKHKDMKHLFMGMADRQILHYETVSGPVQLQNEV